jgi:hypothetical protein
MRSQQWEKGPLLQRNRATTHELSRRRHLSKIKKIYMYATCVKNTLGTDPRDHTRTVPSAPPVKKKKETYYHLSKRRFAWPAGP